MGEALINLNESKAFDEAVFREVGFGPVFCSWITALYNPIRSVVHINGHLSRPFYCMYSVRQGSPLSSLLYTLTLAPLLLVTRELRCGSSVSAYGDDVSIIVSSYRLIDKTLKEYEAVM